MKKKLFGFKITRRHIIIASAAFLLIVAVIVFASVVRNVNKPIAPEASDTPSPVISESPSPTPTPTPTPTPSETPSESPSETPTETPAYTGPFSPLTGLPSDTELAAVRPVAVMLDNAENAQPHLGISKADIIFEAPVEGGITRMMAVFSDVSGIAKIGGIRSSRLYFLDMALAYDAIYIHAGGSPGAYDGLKSLGVTNLDGVNGGRQQIFLRDKDREKKLGSVHALITTSELINKYLPTYKFRLEHEAGYKYGIEFADEAAPEGGQKAEAFNVSFGHKLTSFKYSEKDLCYYASQFSKTYADGSDNAPVPFQNVVVVRAPINQIANDEEGRLNVNLKGGGKGCFINGGKYIDMTWEKKDAKSPFVFKDATGKNIIFGRGKTYICIIPASASVTFGA